MESEVLPDGDDSSLIEELEAEAGGVLAVTTHPLIYIICEYI